MHSVLECPKQSMQGAQERSKFYPTRKEVWENLKVGQKEFLKVTLKHSRLKLGRSKNLSSRICAPFQIVKRSSQMAYALNLSKDWKIDNIFHARLLRR